MNDGSAPFWGALITILIFVVGFGRDLASRFFTGYDELKKKGIENEARLETIEADSARSARRIGQLEEDLLDAQRARDKAQGQAKDANDERDTVKLENVKLERTVKDLSSAQEQMRVEINEIKRDREERQKIYDARLADEQQRREQAETARALAEQERDHLRTQFQTEIAELKREIAELRAQMPTHAEPPLVTIAPPPAIEVPLPTTEPSESDPAA